MCDRRLAAPRTPYRTQSLLREGRLSRIGDGSRNGAEISVPGLSNSRDATANGLRPVGEQILQAVRRRRTQNESFLLGGAPTGAFQEKVIGAEPVHPPEEAFRSQECRRDWNVSQNLALNGRRCHGVGPGKTQSEGSRHNHPNKPIAHTAGRPMVIGRDQ